MAGGNLLAQPAASTHLYICGPTGFIDDVTSVARKMGWPDTNVHVERFGAEIGLDGDPFTVVARRSGLEVEVPPGTSIAEQLIKAGVQVPMSCQSGVCGTCLTRVVSGSPDHRDAVQTGIEKAGHEHVAVCCSRSHSRMLVLDIEQMLFDHHGREVRIIVSAAGSPLGHVLVALSAPGSRP